MIWSAAVSVARPMSVKCGDGVAGEDAEDERDHFDHLLAEDGAAHRDGERHKAADEAEVGGRALDEHAVDLRLDRAGEEVAHGVAGQRQADDGDGRPDDDGRHELIDPADADGLDDDGDDDIDKAGKGRAEQQTRVAGLHGHRAGKRRGHRA